MLPSIEEWLTASWADYRRRWFALMGVIGIGFAVMLAVAFPPLLAAGVATYAGAGPLWLIWLGAWLFLMLAGLWFSTWIQAAVVRAAANDESAGDALRIGWRQTPAFAWVLSLTMLAAGGGFVLFVVPGLALSVLLFFAPYYQLSGEERGMGALELSFARVKPAFATVSARLALVALSAWLAAKIPFVGWLLGSLAAPFALVAYSRLANDLKTAYPAPVRPSLGGVVGALSLVLVLGMFVVYFTAARAAQAVYKSYASGRLELKAPDAETAQSLLSVLQGQGSDADKLRSATYVLSLSSAAAAAP